MGNADVIGMMIVAIIVSTLELGVMMKVQKIMNVSEINDTWINGMKSVFFTIVFIVLAWTVSSFCKSLGTANFVVGALVAAEFPAWILPTAVFCIAGLMAFATGSSWGTMALVLPLAMPAAVGLGAGFSATLGAVLTGATLGDHISPISESVVMSSMSSACDHMDHVTTQWPYAITVCVISIICGFIPAGLGLPVWISLIAGLAAGWLVDLREGIRLGKYTQAAYETIRAVIPTLGPGRIVYDDIREAYELIRSEKLLERVEALDKAAQV